jgi:hypothetical protein
LASSPPTNTDPSASRRLFTLGPIPNKASAAILAAGSGISALISNATHQHKLEKTTANSLVIVLKICQYYNRVIRKEDDPFLMMKIQTKLQETSVCSCSMHLMGPKHWRQRVTMKSFFRAKQIQLSPAVESSVNKLVALFNAEARIVREEEAMPTCQSKEKTLSILSTLL